MSSYPRALDDAPRTVFVGLVSREAFLSRVNKVDVGCWEWQGPRGRLGYGTMSVPGMRSPQNAHRVSYELWKGPIPEGFDVDHLCRNPPCVNPTHLEAVTHRENILRGDTFAARNIAKTHCAQGHEYTPENTRRAAGAPNKRKCRECCKASSARHYAKRRASK